MSDNGLPESYKMPKITIDAVSKSEYISAIMSRRTYPNLAAFFKATGMTQEQLAKRLGISQSSMSKITRGITGPSLELALRIERAAGVPIESLLRAEYRETTGNSCV